MNQNNQNVRQITPEEIREAEGLPKPLTAEELQKTQVLNLNDLEKTIKFEKITSKKPAIIIAVIGILLLTFGTTFQIASSLSSNKKVEKRKTEPEPTIVEKSLSCVKTTLNDTDGTDKIVNADYYFENDKLSSVIKVYKYTASANNPAGEATIKTNLDTYQKLLSSTSGYQVDTSSVESKSLEIKVQVDYHSRFNYNTTS